MVGPSLRQSHIRRITSMAYLAQNPSQCCVRPLGNEHGKDSLQEFLRAHPHPIALPVGAMTRASRCLRPRYRFVPPCSLRVSVITHRDTTMEETGGCCFLHVSVCGTRAKPLPLNGHLAGRWVSLWAHPLPAVAPRSPCPCPPGARRVAEQASHQHSVGSTCLFLHGNEAAQGDQFRCG